MLKFSLLVAAWVVSASVVAAPLPPNVISGTMGEIHIEGTLLSSTCGLRMETPTQNVDLGKISAKGLNKTGARSAGVPFKLHFSGCLIGAYEQEPIGQRLQILETQANGGNADLFVNGQYGVVVMLVGEPDLHNQQLLKLHGDTKGVGIRLSDAHGEKLVVNQPNKAYVLTPGESTLTFYAGLESTQEAIRAGNFNAVVNVRLSYL